MTAAPASAQPVGVVWHMSEQEQPLRPAPKLPARFGPVRPASVAELAQAMGGADPAAVQQRLDARRRCYAVWCQEQLAAYGWVSVSDEDVGELGLRVRLQPGEAYIWECATRPAYQRQGLYAALLGYVTETLRAEGVGGIWIGADFGNTPSQVGIGRAGFTAVADLVAALPQPGEHRRRAWLAARPGISPERLAEARRVYLDRREEVWLFK